MAVRAAQGKRRARRLAGESAPRVRRRELTAPAAVTGMSAVRSFLLCLALAAPAFAAPPVDLNDGLRVGTLAEAHLRTGPFESLTPDVVAAQFPDTTSVLVYKDGRLVYERYFGAGGLNGLHDSRSATKTVTALLVGQA